MKDEGLLLMLCSIASLSVRKSLHRVAWFSPSSLEGEGWACPRMPESGGEGARRLFFCQSRDVVSEVLVFALQQLRKLRAEIIALAPLAHEVFPRVPTAELLFRHVILISK